MGHLDDYGTRNKKSGYRMNDNRLIALRNMARPARFERATAWFVARYSIQLSYGREERGIIFVRTLCVKANHPL